MSSPIRLTGMATGLDTDTTIKQMMSAYQTRLDKMNQDKQIVSWKQELYRDILSDINSFKSTYFDVLKSDTYMLSRNSMSGFSTTVVNSIDGQQAGVSVTASTGATAGSYSVKVIDLAEAAKLEGGELNTSTTINLANWEGKTIEFQVGTTTASINLDGSYATNEDLRDSINTKIAANSDLAGKISASLENGAIKFNVLTDSTVKITNNTNVTDMDTMKGKVINPKKTSTMLSDLGVANGSFSLQYTDSSGSIQNKTITISDANTTTIDELIQKVSTETSGNVLMKYSELTGSFSIETLGKGSTATLTATDTNGILAELNITAAVNGGDLSDEGQNAKAEITDPEGNTKTIIKTSNSFTIDNILYTLKTEGTTNNIDVATDVQKPFDKIKAFIDKYNETIEKISSKISEKKQYTFLPLTDEQKEEMSDEEVEKWETKAKQGLLKSDSMLQNMITSLRGAFYQAVEGAGITLNEIGLSTSSDYSQKGKIIIDEAKLKDALTNRGEQVASIFIKASTTHPTFSPSLTSSERTTRSSEEGIFQRIQDIFQDYTRTIRDNSGKKGLLLEKAGLKGDLSEFKNLLTKDLEDRQKRIDDFLDKMADKENRYYLQFSKLETAMNQMNSQSSWLAQQLGTSG